MNAFDAERNKRAIISAATLGLRTIASLEVTRSNDLKEVKIKSGYQFVPNFTWVWNDFYKHYLVYIDVASSCNDKKRAGYAICRIRSPLIASFFVSVVHFLVTNRARAEVV